jgi:uncharacterized membrane protein YcaP (DUF421 family)
MSWLTAAFGQKGDVSILQECARTAVIFAYALVLVRLAARPLSGKWSGIDIILSVILGPMLSRAITGTAPLLGTMAAAALVVALHWLVTHIAALQPMLSHAIEGKPIVLAEGGELPRGRSRMHAVSEADVAEGLRKVGLEQIEHTERIVLEPSGRLTVLKKRPNPGAGSTQG